MEKVEILVTGHQSVLAGINDFLKGCLGCLVVLGKEISLAGQRIGKAFRHAISPIFVVDTLALGQVGHSSLALLGDPLVILLLRHLAVGRNSLCVEQMIDERRLAPIAGQEEEVIGAQDSCLGDSLLLESSGRIGEMVEDEIIVIDREIQATVMEVDGIGIALIAELVDGATKLMVAVVATTVEHVVARIIGQHTCRRVDTRAVCHGGTAERVDHKSLISRCQCLFTISISLVEFRSRLSSLLLYVQLVSAGGK